jgi:CRP-like cAMP-binding protein
MTAILQKYPAVALKVIYSVATRVRQAWTLVEDLSFSQVTGRLAKMLLKREEEKGEWPRLTQQDMAAMVGTTRVVVNRSLRIMEDGRAIRLERYGIVITDKQALQRMAEHL